MNYSFQQIKEESNKDFNELVDGIELVNGAELNKEYKLRLEKFYSRTFDNLEKLFLLISAETYGVKKVVDNCQAGYQVRFNSSLKSYFDIRIRLIGIIGVLLLTIWGFYTFQIVEVVKKQNNMIVILNDFGTRLRVLEATYDDMDKRIKHETFR